MSSATTREKPTGDSGRTTDEARSMVDDLIADGGDLVVIRVDNAPEVSHQIGPVTRDFFSRFATLRTKGGGFVLAAKDIGPSEYMPGYLSIGHSEDWDIVQRPGEDEVFVVEGAETSEAEVEIRFASVYHLILDEVGRDQLSSP